MAVGFFTHGIEYKLPHPPIPKRTILLICRVIKRAWQLLEEKPPSGFVLHFADEDAITRVLVGIIENRLRKNGEVDGFNCALFGKVSRDQKIPNVDNCHPDKMPDIFFDLRRDQLPILSNQDGFFVECKPVDRTHPVFSCYCKMGLVRFLTGDYAWAMQDALMVGYAKHPYSFKKLSSVLSDDKKRTILKTTDHFGDDDYGIYCSKHIRDFQWPESLGQACPIAICHLWLRV